MTRRRPAYAKVYRMLDDDHPAVIRYSGDPDEYYALAHAWLMNEYELHYDYPIAVAPPQIQWFRMNPYPGDDYAWSIGYPSGPGRGNWQGSYLRVVKVGCSECQYRNGLHHPGGCLNADLVGLETCMLTPRGGPHGLSEPARRRAKQMIHLVRRRAAGTPGPTLCDLDRFGPGVSFEMGGGYTWEGAQFTACYMCVRYARRELPELEVHTSMREFAQAFINQAVPVTRPWAEQLTPAMGTPGAWALAEKVA